MDKITDEDKEIFYKTGVLPQHSHLKSYEEAMPVIRKLLGLSEHGRMPDNFIGRTMQTFIDANRQKTLRQGVTIDHPPIEPGG